MEPEQLIEQTDKDLRQILSLLQTFNPATEDVVSADESGKVTVTFRPDNTLASINVAPDWSSEIEDSMLAAVVSEHLGRAQAKVLGFDIDQLAALDEGGPGERSAEVNLAHDKLIREAEDKLLRPRSDAEIQDMVNRLPDMFDEIDQKADAALAKLSEADDLPQDPADHVVDADAGEQVHSDNRMVSLRVVRGHIAEVSIKESWLGNRSGIAVTECFNQIIERLPEAVASQTRTGA